MDTISVNGCLFLTTISLDIYYQSAHFVKNKTSSEYKKQSKRYFGFTTMMVL